MYDIPGAFCEPFWKGRSSPNQDCSWNCPLAWNLMSPWLSRPEVGFPALEKWLEWLEWILSSETEKSPEDDCVAELLYIEEWNFWISFSVQYQNCVYNSQISVLIAAFPWKDLSLKKHVWNCWCYIFSPGILGAWTCYQMRERPLCPHAKEYSGGSRGQDEAELKAQCRWFKGRWHGTEVWHQMNVNSLCRQQKQICLFVV